MDYTELASLITENDALYKITFQDGTEKIVRLYVHNSGFYECPCLTDMRGDAHVPFPLYELKKIASVSLV